MRVEPRIVEELRKLGFERVEQLLTTERAPVARRFALDLYRGSTRLLAMCPSRSSRFFAEAIPRARRRLLEPIATAEAFAQVIGDLAADLAGELVRAAKGARTLDLFFHRVDGHVQAVRVGTATPTRDPRHIAKLLTPRIETGDPGLGIEAMTLVAPLVEPFAASRSELDCSGKRGPDLPALVDTLANRFGQRSLYQLGARPNAMPERGIATLPAIAPSAPLAWRLR